MPEDLAAALARLRPLLLDAGNLVRAVAAGHRRGARPGHVRVEIRPVDLKGGRMLQVVTTDDGAPVTRNHPPERAAAELDRLLAEPFGNWHVQTRDQVVQLRVTKKGLAQVHVSASGEPAAAAAEPVASPHDRVKHRLLDPGDPLFDALQADADKRRQVDAFLRVLAPSLPRLLAAAAGAGRPVQAIDLGCGNAYLTFAAHRWLRAEAARADPPVPVRSLGIEARPELVDRNRRLAGELDLTGLEFVAGTIAGSAAELDRLGFDRPDLALALHACDTATDEALAVAVRREVPVLLAAPCCHHDLQRQLDAARAAGAPVPHPYQAVTRHPILRERFADVLTDGLRADLLRLLGYRVDVVEFVASRHTPRNVLLRAYRTGARPGADRVAEYRDLVTGWALRPALGELLADRLEPILGQPIR